MQKINIFRFCLLTAAALFSLSMTSLPLSAGALVANGVEPIHALRMSTIFAADLLGGDDRGEIVAGKLADMIAVEGNPLNDIRVMEDVSFVMKGGVVYKLK